MIIYIIKSRILKESGDFTWRVSDCEELVEFTQRSECHFLKLNGAKVAHF